MEVPAGSHVAVNPNLNSLSGRFSVSMLDVIVAVLDEGVPIQFAALSPVINILREVELGQ